MKHTTEIEVLHAIDALREDVKTIRLNLADAEQRIVAAVERKQTDLEKLTSKLKQSQERLEKAVKDNKPK